MPRGRPAAVAAGPAKRGLSTSRPPRSPSRGRSKSRTRSSSSNVSVPPLPVAPHSSAERSRVAHPRYRGTVWQPPYLNLPFLSGGGGEKKRKNWVLSDDTCARLASWKYHSGTLTPLDKQMNKFWEFAVTLLPMSMAPNLVTFTGLLIVGFTTSLLVWHDPTFSTPSPSWVYLVAMLGHFLYQTFDAIDGKQARRTGSSSPLGQLFDHGCDAFITNLIGLLNGCCMQYGAGYHTMLNTLFNFNCFFLAQWEEYHTGVLNTNNGLIGLTEGQLAQMAMMLSVAVLGPESWANNNFPFTNIPWRYFALFPMGGITVMLALQSLYRVFFSVRQSRLVTSEDRGARDLSTSSQLLQLLPQYLLYSSSMLWTQTPFFANNTLLVFMTCGVACSFYTTTIIVAQMSKSHIEVSRGFFCVALPVALCALLCTEATTFSTLCSSSSSSSGEGSFSSNLLCTGGSAATEWLQTHVLKGTGWDARVAATWLTAIVVTVHYLFYVVGVCFDLSNELNIYVFSIKKKEKRE